MSEELKPILVGIDTEKVTEEITLWEKLFQSLNDFFGDWMEYYKEPLSLEEFRKFQEVEDKPFYLGEKYVSKQKVYADFMERIKIKIRKLVDMVDMPSYEHLIVGSDQVANMLLRVHADDLRAWLERCKTESGFVLLEELQAEIVQRNSTYARSGAEILAFLYQRRFCEMINLLADAGRETDPSDLPPIFLQGVLWQRSKALPWLEKPPRHCEPGPGLMREGSPLVARLSKFPDDHVLKLIKEFSGSDVS